MWVLSLLSTQQVAGLKHREMCKWKLELKQLDSVWYGRSTKFKNSGGWDSPQGENLEESPDGNKDKESGLIRNIERGFDENVLAMNYGRHASAAKHQAKGKRGLEGTGLGQASCFIP